MENMEVERLSYQFPVSPEDMARSLRFAHWHRKRGYEVKHVIENNHLITYLAGRAIQACLCTPSERHGETSVMCCNECGQPVEDFWNKK